MHWGCCHSQRTLSLQQSIRIVFLLRASKQLLTGHLWASLGRALLLKAERADHSHRFQGLAIIAGLDMTRVCRVFVDLLLAHCSGFVRRLLLLGHLLL